MTTLAEVAQDILDFAVAALGPRAPARQFLGAGLVAFDCEQISASWAPRGLYQSSEGFLAPSTQIAKRPQVTAADFLVEVVRCVPGINSEMESFPDPAELTSAATDIMTDAETLYCAFAEACQPHNVPLFGGCRLMSLGGAAPYGPSGGMGGVRLPLTVQVGCEPAQGS
jgi:hypothetical protein